MSLSSTEIYTFYLYISVLSSQLGTKVFCKPCLEPKSGGLWTDLPGENDLPIPTYVDIFVARGHISANNLEFKPPRV